jgi:hypothetical protein
VSPPGSEDNVDEETRLARARIAVVICDECGLSKQLAASVNHAALDLAAVEILVAPSSARICALALAFHDSFSRPVIEDLAEVRRRVEQRLPPGASIEVQAAMWSAVAEGVARAENVRRDRRGRMEAVLLAGGLDVAEIARLTDRGAGDSKARVRMRIARFLAKHGQPTVWTLKALGVAPQHTTEVNARLALPNVAGPSGAADRFSRSPDAHDDQRTPAAKTTRRVASTPRGGTNLPDVVVDSQALDSDRQARKQ